MFLTARVTYIRPWPIPKEASIDSHDEPFDLDPRTGVGKVRVYARRQWGPLEERAAEAMAYKFESLPGFSEVAVVDRR
jgi:hypothetical protein